ncbi:MAG TPA: DUF6675 family protein [Micropepsaceae bacterium]|nr:DUF6675 family protein [Micropepsaceae bacterium]
MTLIAALPCAYAALAATAVISVQPRPPCAAADPVPGYAPLDAPPNIALSTARDTAASWNIPACTVWTQNSATLVVGLAGRFHSAADPAALLARIGAISSLTDVRYWSVTDKRWNAMFTRAFALDGRDPGKRRADFSADDLLSGRELNFLAADNRSGRDAVSSLRVTGDSNSTIVLETANATPLRWFLLSFAAPGNVQTWYFFTHETGDSWRFYSFTRVLYAARLFERIIPDASYINRAVAMFRYFSDVPTDRDPPAAP